jgi:hypothetical protein
MSEGLDGCAVCGPEALGARMSKVVVEGRALHLCRAHAATVVAEMPETFEDLRALFVGAGVDLDARARRGPPPIPERRSPIGRRAPEDRRLFPPRPEGRRRNGGRRAGDPLD